MFFWNQDGVYTYSIASNDFQALQALGSAIKCYVPGNIIYTVNNPQNLVSGTIYFVAVYTPVPVTISGLICFMSGTGSYTSLNYNGVGFYTINLATGLLTQVAASTTSTTVWAAPQGKNQIPFAAPYVAAAGIYYSAYLFQASAIVTNPKLILTQPSNIVPGMDFANSIKLQMHLNGQTALPATILASAINSGSNMNLYHFGY